jgi:putative transposase
MKTLNPTVARVHKRLHYPLDVILMCVRWYVSYSLSLRNLEEMMAERGMTVDHSTLHRWAIKLLPMLGVWLPFSTGPFGLIKYPLFSRQTSC